MREGGVHDIAPRGFGEITGSKGKIALICYAAFIYVRGKFIGILGVIYGLFKLDNCMIATG